MRYVRRQNLFVLDDAPVKVTKPLGRFVRRENSFLFDESPAKTVKPKRSFTPIERPKPIPEPILYRDFDPGLLKDTVHETPPKAQSVEKPNDLLNRINELQKQFEDLKQFIENNRSEGGGSFLLIQNDGEPVGGYVSKLNFTGADVTVDEFGAIEIPIGGGGGTPETPAEAANGSNTVFTVSAQPKSVVADGITYYEGHGYTYSALQITMALAPSFYIRVNV